MPIDRRISIGTIIASASGLVAISIAVGGIIWGVALMSSRNDLQDQRMDNIVASFNARTQGMVTGFDKRMDEQVRYNTANDARMKSQLEEMQRSSEAQMTEVRRLIERIEDRERQRLQGNPRRQNEDARQPDTQVQEI